MGIILRTLALPPWLICLFAITLSAQNTFAEIYTWRDEKGVLHFGDKLIDGIEQEKVKTAEHKSYWQKYVINIYDVDNVLTEDETKRISKDVNVIYQFYDKKLFFDIYKTVPVSIHIFSEQSGYRAFLSSLGYADKGNSRGMYLPKENKIALFVNPKQRWRTFWTVKHEVSHAIVDTLAPYAPAWLNEGLAENMESISARDNEFYMLPHSENFIANRVLSQDYSAFNLRKILNSHRRAFYAANISTKGRNQASVGEFVRMLLSSSLGRKFLIQVVHSYQSDRSLPKADFVDKFYTGGFVALESDWMEWIKRPESGSFAL